MGSSAYDQQQGSKDEQRAAMKRKGYFECENCGELFMPDREENIICSDCIARAMED
ncbi:hypothetical protein [Carnobacterium maltaromaticum]|uniref:hypothetical protein n=1 Tax=Carnobacterium maltaromaticum TaxID=2751 RepID=UPI0039B0525E